MDRRLYWLWITTKDKMSARKITKILDCVGSVDQVYEADKSKLAKCGLESDMVKLLCDKSMKKAEAVFEQTKNMGIDIMTIEDEDYPKNLLNIFDPPYVLYLLGNRINLNDRLCISMVGTRECTKYGYAMAAQIAYDLARCSVAVVSGMAEGIDSAAHIGALKSGGATVAILANGLDICFPSSNFELMKKIMETGMILSEYPPGVNVDRFKFPVRNRIISGISQGVAVIEAPVRSGALITARSALEQSRDVFCMPGPVNSEESRGVNRFIREEGGKLIECAADILVEYADYFAKMQNEIKATKKEKKFSIKTLLEMFSFSEVKEMKNVNLPKLTEDPRYEGLTEEEQRVMENLMAEPVHMDELAKKCKMDIASLSSVLTMLEINGYAESRPGKQFCLKI